MKGVSIIAPVYKSVIRAINDMIDTINATGDYPEVAYHDWESRGDQSLLPQKTLIGTEGFSFEEDGGLWQVRFALGLSSYQDANLLNEIELLDYIHANFFGEGHKVPMLSMEDGSVISELVVANYQLLPMAQSEVRNYRGMGLTLLRTGT